MEKLFFLLALWLLSHQIPWAQNRRAIDSLQAILPNAQHDTSLAKIYNSLSSQFFTYNNDSSLLFAKEGWRISEKAGYKMGIAKALANIGRVHLNRDNYPEALQHLHQALAIYEEIGSQSGQESVNFSLGHTYLGQSNYPEALNTYLKCLKMSEQRGDLEGMSRYYHAISMVYGGMNNLTERRRYVNLALELAEKGDNKSHLATLYSSLSSIEFLEKNYKKALELAEKALQFAEQTDNMSSRAHALASIGNIWIAMGEGTKSLSYLKKSMAICKARGYKRQLTNLLSQTGYVYLKRKEYSKAFRIFQDRLTLATEIGGADIICWANDDLYDYYLERGNYKKALEHYKTFIIFRDRMTNEENAGQVLKTQLQYDFDKKEAINKAEQDKKDALAQIDLNRQKLVRNGFIGGFALMLCFAGIFFTQRNNIKKSNAALEIAKSRAEASEAFKSRFLANMSHEIRTPLHGIAGFTDLVLETALSEKQRRYLFSIHHSTERLTEVVNDILDISKLEAGEVKLRQVAFSPAGIAADVQEALSLRAENKGIGLSVHIGAGVPEAVSGDPTRLYQILMNLAGNAVKFTEQGSVRLTVDGARWTGDGSPPANPPTLKFSISDSGIGIPPEKLSTIFDSFQQASDDTTARFGGTGLGLTIAQELVQLHGSHIHVESALGKGSTFSFVLHLPVADVADLEKTSGTAGDLYSQKLKILLADDNALNREIATEAIRRHFEHADIVEAVNGKEVIALLEQRDFDLVLMDMQMPEMNGLEATQHIRQQFTDLKRVVPIIALTASATPEEIEKALESGMQRHLGKPFKPIELARVIAETLGLRPAPATAVSEPQPLSPTPATEAAEAFDLRFLRDFCDGDEAQVQRFIQQFKAQCPLEIERLELAFQKEDRAAIYQAAHRFKPQLEFVGLKKAAVLAGVIEREAREGEVDGGLLEALKKEIEVGLEVLKMEWL